jgi:transporter family-2 protein
MEKRESLNSLIFAWRCVLRHGKVVFMQWSLLLPVLLGVASVLQAGFNRQISRSHGLPSAVLLNTCVLLSVALALFFWSRTSPESLPAALRPAQRTGSPALWYVLPGLFGFCLVAGIPLAISRVGALKVFVLVIGAQLTASLLWDAWVEARPVNAVRVVGAAISCLGAVLVSLKG